MKSTARIRRQGLTRVLLPLLALTLLPTALACAPADPIIDGDLPWNFHELDPGQAYRSGQPTESSLTNVINQLGIKTVVNLRGPNPGEDWYDTEKRVCEALGVTLVDHPMSKSSLPSAELLGAVEETLLTAEYPILIHCQGGADRTGAVSAIYQMLILGQDRATALLELTPATLHFRFYAPCMDTLAELYEPSPDWLDYYAQIRDDLTCQ